jgi:undecaprenyl-diphosphatase
MSSSAPAGWWKRLAGVAPRDRLELELLVGAFAVVGLVFLFFHLASEVVDGDTQKFDTRILLALRDPHDPSVPIGPAWLQSGALDLTALGSSTVLGLATLSICGFLLLQGMTRTAVFVFVASAGGWLLNDALKQVFQRSRPDVVPHLREVFTTSFPSGHAMSSAAVYLTLGALMMRVAERPIAKWYCMTIAMLLTILVGASRVYAGVHYPTDVVAGWLMGLTWALVCWLVERRLEGRAGLRQEQREGRKA